VHSPVWKQVLNIFRHCFNWPPFKHAAHNFTLAATHVRISERAYTDNNLELHAAPSAGQLHTAALAIDEHLTSTGGTWTSWNKTSSHRKLREGGVSQPFVTTMSPLCAMVITLKQLLEL
jgi:hypothetical protein